MADLIPTPALDHPPLTNGGVTLAPVDPGPIHAILPFPGGRAAVDAALAPLGLAFPPANRWQGSGPARIVWTGREAAFLLGAPPPDLPAAVSDQSDGWAALRLTGPGAVEVLARLTPLDLRRAAPGHAARAALFHQPMVLMAEEGGFLILVFRSMARTAWHEIAGAMARVAARALA